MSVNFLQTLLRFSHYKPRSLSFSGWFLRTNYTKGRFSQKSTSAWDWEMLPGNTTRMDIPQKLEGLSRKLWLDALRFWKAEIAKYDSAHFLTMSKPHENTAFIANSNSKMFHVSTNFLVLLEKFMLFFRKIAHFCLKFWKYFFKIC